MCAENASAAMFSNNATIFHCFQAQQLAVEVHIGGENWQSFWPVHIAQPLPDVSQSCHCVLGFGTRYGYVVCGPGKYGLDEAQKPVRGVDSLVSVRKSG